MQTVVSNRAMTPEEERRQRLYVRLNQDSQNVSLLLDLLSVIVDAGDWDRLQDRRGRPLNFRTYVELPFAEGGIGWTVPNLRTVLLLQHDQEQGPRVIPETAERLSKMRERVKTLLVASPPALPPQKVGKGRRGPGRGNKTADNVSRFKHGNDADYLTARIARDHPEIHERMKAGEFRSVRAAAIEAGLIRVPTRLEHLQSQWRKATPEERREFRAWIDEE